METTIPEVEEEPAIDLTCTECGYGIVARGEPPECPMCRAWNWRELRRPALALAA